MTNLEKVHFTKIVDNSKRFPTVYRTSKSEVTEKVMYRRIQVATCSQDVEIAGQTAACRYVPVKSQVRTCDDDFEFWICFHYFGRELKGKTLGFSLLRFYWVLEQKLERRTEEEWRLRRRRNWAIVHHSIHLLFSKLFYIHVIDLHWHG